MLIRNYRIALICGLVIVVLGITIPAMFAGGAKSSYRVNSKSYRADPTFRKVLHGSTISLNAGGLTAKEILREIERQSDVDVAFDRAFDRGSDKRLKIFFQDTPFWVAIAEVCKAGNWPCKITTEPAVRVSENGDTPIDGYQVKGPFFLLWSVLKDGKIQCRLLCDPGSDARVYQPRVDPEFRVVLRSGRTISVKPEEEVQDGMGGRTWRWSSNKAFSGAAKARRVELKLEVAGIADSQEVRVPWGSSQSRRVGKSQLKLHSLKKGTVRDMDPDRWGEFVEFAEFTATIELSNQGTKKYENIMASKRQPTQQEWDKIRASFGNEEFGVRRAWVVGKKGERLKGTMRAANGISGRYRALRRNVSGRTLKRDFEPKELVILCGGTRKVVNLQFKIENVPLKR